MLNLNEVLDIHSIDIIRKMVNSRFKVPSKFKTPESLILYEQGYVDNDILLRLCNEVYCGEYILEEPFPTSYIPQNIRILFKDTKFVPVKYIPSKKEIHVVFVPEYGFEFPEFSIYDVKCIPTTLHYYIKQYTTLYGEFEELLPIPGLQALRGILEEAIRNNVPDLTISSVDNRVIVYYNKNKQKEMSTNIFPGSIMDEILKVLTISSPIADMSENKSKYVSYDIDDEYRSRVVINKNIYGYVITIRLFSKLSFSKSMEDLNLNSELIELFRDKSINRLNGLRLIVGETMSGKNTTALSILKEIVEEGKSKVVSIEMPVEQKIDGVEQINTEFIDEYVSNIESLIHQNPDFVYITETKDETGKAVMKIANTGKCVLSTLHSNSVADTISRISDITGFSSNRIIQVLHTIVYQELRRVGDNVYPYTRFVYFDDELKQQLYDKPFGEVIRIIKSRERGGFNDDIRCQYMSI